METQIWIPAQGSSQRISDKNFRNFYNGNSLLEIAVNKLVQITSVSDIYVSSESSQCEEICLKLGVNFIERDSSLTGNGIKQKDLFNHFFQNTPDSKYLGWVQVTDPLFDDFKGLFELIPSQDEVIVAASKLRKHAFFEGHPINFQFGDWHPVTQDITPIIIPRWSVFYAMRETFQQYKYHFGKINRFYTTDEQYVDIDYEQDFKLAQLLYEAKQIGD